MRPLALRLQAFGSYAGEFAIDFARLGHHGVFSITGPTGAGKSTIFDAIVYALYDDLPGFRVNSHVRSQYADRGTRTEVTLEFEADGRRWLLTRSPAQTRPSGRAATGTVDDASTVVLAEVGVDGSAVTKKREVSDRIDELVGLDKAQFEQVVLIPQGKFEEVLKAKTQERAELLAKLFPVDVYIRTTDVLRQSAFERREAYEALTRDRRTTEERIVVDVTAIRGLVPGPQAPDGTGPDAEPTTDGESPSAEVDLTRPAELRDELVTLVATVVAARDVAAGICETARAERTAVEARVVRYHQWRADTVEAASFVEEVAQDDQVVRDLERAATVATLGGALAAWREADERVGTLALGRPRLRAAVGAHWVDTYDVAVLDDHAAAMRLASAVATDADTLERADAAFADLEARGRALDGDEAELVERTAALAAAVEGLSRTAGLRAAAGAALDAATDRVAARPEAVVLVDGLDRDATAARARVAAEHRLTRLTGQLEAAAGAASDALTRLAGLRLSWRSGLAGHLAAHLVDGEPCPTCGALDHPSPATGPADAPSDDELDEAEAAATSRAEERQALEVQMAEARGVLESLPVTADASTIEARLGAARSDLEAIDTVVAGLEGQRAEAHRLADLEASTVADIERQRSSLDGRAGALAERRTRWVGERDAFVAEHGVLASTAGRAAERRALATAVEDLAVGLNAQADAESARAQHLAALAGTVAAFGVDGPSGLQRWALTAEQVEAAVRRLDERAEHRRVVTARIEDYAADGGPDGEPDPAPALAAEHAATAAHNDLVGRVASMTSRLDAVTAAVTELAEGADAIESAMLAKEEAETLSGLCAGLGSGPDASKLSLKNWVLAYYLRQVLAHANRRLHTMTNGRYALDLSGEHADGRRPWGLDISVLDAETGQSRPATTLSGGETFMAALALALGLADVVSAGSNYSIGALFVDEGFGSLDGDSLDTVIDVLRSLQDGGRMVGVISHVQELKDALPDGITIQPTNHGSVARIHYPDA